MVNHGVFGELWGLASKRKPPQLRRGFMLVPRVGLEPTHPEGYWILNPARLLENSYIGNILATFSLLTCVDFRAFNTTS